MFGLTWQTNSPPQGDWHRLWLVLTSQGGMESLPSRFPPFFTPHIQPFVLTPLAAFRRNAYTSGWWYTQEPSFQNWRMHRAWDLFSIPGTRVKVRDTYPFIHSLTKHLASARLRKMEERADLGLGNGCLAMTTSAWTIKKENWSIGPHRNGWCLCFKRHH